MVVIKRNGSEVQFNPHKIDIAISKANDSVESRFRLGEATVRAIVDKVVEKCEALRRAPQVEEIQDMVERELMASGAYEVAKGYITYRYEHALMRNGGLSKLSDRVLSIVDCDNEEAKQENANKNPIINSTQRDYMASEVSEDIVRNRLLPRDIVEAHDQGIIHFHDMGYSVGHLNNCELINLEDMLQNGTVINGTLIERPHSFSTACNITTQVISLVASNTFGGQTFSLAHLAPFVDVSRKKIRKSVEAEIAGIDIPNDKIDEITESRLKEEISRGVQMIQYQVLTLLTTNGQAPFVTTYMYLGEAKDKREKEDLAMIIEETLKQRYEGVKNEVGEWVTPSFPKLVYVLDEDNVREGAPYWYLTKLAAKCTAKRMVPDYISAKKMLELKGDVYACMGCRAFLTSDRFTDAGVGNIANAGNYEPGKHKYYGRFNSGVVTLNLPDVALSSGGDCDKFWEILSERLDLCHRALRWRIDRLLGTPSDVAPILWQYGAIARLGKGEPIDKLLFNGYSTISLGYAGLYECVRYMTGKSHASEDAITMIRGGEEVETTPHKFAMDVMQRLNDACAEWRAAENIDYSVYGTPIESVTYKFAKCLQKRFGVIEDVTDHSYTTNSFHINVREKIDAFSKLSIEGEFQRLSPGGMISYVEVPNMQNNIPAVLAVMRHIYENTLYGELNTKSDYCQVCGWDGEINIVENDDGKLIWKCPKCGNTDQRKMNVVRRVCGYLGTNYFNQGRTAEIRDRVLHL